MKEDCKSMDMTVGERIKFYRQSRNITQEMLSELSGIHLSTIKKYELGLRNPKPEQLKRIADAIGVSVYVFMDFEIETVSDVMAVFDKLEAAVEITFHGKKKDDGLIDPEDLSFSFDNKILSDYMSKYSKCVEIIHNNSLERSDCISDADYECAMENVSTAEDLKMRLLTDCTIIKKGTKGLQIKVYPR